MFQMNDAVSLYRCEDYIPEKVAEVLACIFDEAGFTTEALTGKTVAIKPNLVMKMDPAQGGTTHPIVVAEAAKLLIARGAKVTLVESPGGLYSAPSLKNTYHGCGMDKAAEESGMELNYDLSAEEVPCPDGVQSKMFHLLSPIWKADYLVNLCKLKTHGLTAMSGAVKNYFGTIPGIEKFEMHARFPQINDFENMLLDLCTLHHTARPVLNICDAIVGMEGNGPTGGSPKPLGAILASANPYNLDRVGAYLMGLDGQVPMLEKAIGRGYCPAELADIEVRGELPDDMKTVFAVSDATKKSRLNFFLTLGNGKFSKPFEPRPYVDRNTCIGCGECIRSCPQHTIGWYKNNDGKGRKADIHPKDCIRCFCCQELCPHKAVQIRKNPILYLIGKIR